jgi:WD40 repeat protein
MDPTGVRIAMGCDDGFVRIAAIARGEIERVLSYEDQPFFGEVTASVEAFSPDGEHILTTSYSFEGVRSWNVMSGKEEWRNDADIYDGGGISVKYAENGATAFLSRRARFIDAKSGHTLRELGSDRSLIYSMSADGNHVLGIEAGVVVVLDAKTFTPQSRIRVGGSVGVSVQKEPEKDASGR